MTTRANSVSSTRRRSTRKIPNALSGKTTRRQELVVAMVDALEDILRWERRQAA